VVSRSPGLSVFFLGVPRFFVSCPKGPGVNSVPVQAPSPQRRKKFVARIAVRTGPTLGR